MYSEKHFMSRSRPTIAGDQAFTQAIALAPHRRRDRLVQLHLQEASRYPTLVPRRIPHPAPTVPQLRAAKNLVHAPLQPPELVGDVQHGLGRHARELPGRFRRFGLLDTCRLQGEQ